MSSSSGAPSLDSTYGCLFLAVVFASVLWGVGNVQLYFYYEMHWPRDRWWLRTYVLLAWAIDLVQQVFMLKGIYVYLVTDIGNVPALADQNVYLGYTPLVAGLVDLQVQLLFVYRAWKLSSKTFRIPLVAFLLILVGGEFATHAIYFVQLYNISSSSDLAEFIVTIKTLMSVIMIADTILSVTLVLLLRGRKQDGVKRTNSVINQIMLYSIGTGLITSAWSVAGLVTAITIPEGYAYIMVLEVMPKLYFNCMLTSLNMRKSLTQTDQGHTDLELSAVSSQISNFGAGTRFTETMQVDSKAGRRSCYNESSVYRPPLPVHGLPSESRSDVKEDELSRPVSYSSYGHGSDMSFIGRGLN